MWISDFTISVMLFTVALIIAFTILMNAFNLGADYELMKRDAVRISDYLMSEGTPSDWNETNVVRPGFTSGGRMNETKIYKGMNMTNSSYPAMKSSLQTTYDFIVVFRNMTGGLIPIQDYCSFGKPWTAIEYNTLPFLQCHAVNFTGLKYDNLVKLNRYVVLDSQFTTMEVYLWD